MNVSFFDRDLSWLSFNERVLTEAGNSDVPLLERIKFLSIFSSNLDEFYRVRMPVMMAKNAGVVHEPAHQNVIAKAQDAVLRQQQHFGKLLTEEILPQLRNKNIHVVYNEALPDVAKPALEEYFFSTIAAFLQVTHLSENVQQFFSENNKLYQAVINVYADGSEQVSLVTVPSDQLPRFFSVTINEVQYIVFIDDIICEFLPALFPGVKKRSVFNIKITRDADLGLDDEFAGDIAEEIEQKIESRELGYATRFLYQPGMPVRTLYWLANVLQLGKANMVEGGKYHNLKDFSGIPINGPGLSYPSWPPVKPGFVKGGSLFNAIIEKDRIIHTPYHSYNTVLRFFNEAAIDPAVEEIYVTLYRIANDSKIANALVTAAQNGKNVMVFVELKARFDEANNIRWAKKMKTAGIKIVYSIPLLKVHAKVGLVKKKQDGRFVYLGLFSTGNLNESTARFYTDHILLTARHEILLELELLFIFLSQKRKPVDLNEISFRHLLVAQFNLQPAFVNLIDNEIRNAQQGLPSGIIIKLNNLEEKKMIMKLYEASEAGVPVQLIVRSICCLKPGQEGFSKNIIVTRIVDKYLEHGRIFIFNNNNKEQIFLGSPDWMNRNIYSRIEVCFPVYDEDIKDEIKKIVEIQLADNTQAVYINDQLQNIPVRNEKEKVRSQEEIYKKVMSYE
ncbi:MAG: polyphosphate kinase 1 [Ferruginibacter sp.]